MTNKPSTNNWKRFPFSVDNVNFVSLINPEGKLYKTISKLPAGVFENMNQGAIKSMIGNPSTISLNELQDELNRVNEGYHEAYIALA